MEEFALVEITYRKKDQAHIAIGEVARLEMFIRLYLDLGINVEGLAVVSDLLVQRDLLKQEVEILKRKLDQGF